MRDNWEFAVQNGTTMRIVRLLPTAILAVVGCAVATAGPALADDSLNGHYFAVVDGSRSNLLSTILTFQTTCDPAGNCTGWVTTPKTWGAPVSKPPGGSWTINRTDRAGWTCPNGGTAPADLVYTFAPANLAGSIITTKAAGGCGDPARPTTTHSLQVQKCVDDPTKGVCP
ncbi:hypothetical protein [Mycobacterium sp.]|uniref:hypothetical protein n=1 Tax=Mycobacterium sp. TaxID=1785 RepID=UPI002C68134C|nr:hypothetical protein [Mycobacterium sp.]HTQ18282.1 hypothetical protein [Mycobacterium sp.]